METLFNNIGIACRKFGALKQSVNKNKKVTGKNTKNAKHIMQGQAYYNLGMFTQAITFYKRALKFNPDDEKIHINLGNAYRKLGMFKEAVKSYKYVVHSKPNNAIAHYCLGLAYGKIGMYKQAKNSLEQSLMIDDSNAQAHFNLAIIHLRLEDNTAAISEYRILNDLAPELAGRLTEMMTDQTA